MTGDSLREGSNFEAKLAEGGLPRSLWETYSAFANTDGGIVVLGVKEDKGGRLRIVGVNNPEGLVKQFWDKESLSLSNPGGFRVPIKTAMSGGVSDPRNATILKMFSLIDIGERTGSGIPKIRKTCADMHWPDIAISEEFNPERTITLVALPYNATPEKLDIGVKKPDIGGGKLDIGGEKPDLRAELEGIRLSAPTKCNIERLIANIALEEVFGRARVEEILDLSHGAASNLLRVMKERYLIEAVKGLGKGKYRFANQFRRES